MKIRNKKKGEIVLATNMAVGFADDGTDNWYNSLAELNEEWEDYGLAEPLIKDEKIRKAVRAWAEAQGLTKVYLASDGYEIYGGIDDWTIQFKGNPFPLADKDKIYTIAELCGEEEE